MEKKRDKTEGLSRKMRGRERQTRKRGSQGHRQRQTAKAQALRTMLLIISNVFRTETVGREESREK